MRRFFGTSDLHRQIQRVNGFAEVAGVVVPGSDLPVRVAQTLSSATVFFKPRAKPFEKFVNGIQAVISLVGIGIQVGIMFNHNHVLETSLKALDLIYQGTLLGVWGHSEFLREKSSPRP